MQVKALEIPAVKLIVPQIHRDNRGWFSETYARANLEAAGIDADFVQDNHAYSLKAGVVRGLHFQIPPKAQGKLVRVIRGAVFDVAVDLRSGSPTFGRHVSAVLSAQNWAQLWIPVGFAHGYCTLEADTELIYKVTKSYAPECDRGIAFDDVALRIAWPIKSGEAILSEKDLRLPKLKELAPVFQYT